MVNNEAQPMEEDLKEQILEIIENAQNRTFLSYRNARASIQDFKSDSASRKPVSSESRTGNNVPNMLRDTIYQPPASQSHYSPSRNLRQSTISQRNAQNNSIFDSSSTENHPRTDSWDALTPGRRTTGLTATASSILGDHVNDHTSRTAQSQQNTYEIPSFTSPNPNGLDAAMQHIDEDLSWSLPPYHEHNGNHTPTSQDYRFDGMASLSDEQWNTLPAMEHLNSLNWNPLVEADIVRKNTLGKEKDGFELETEQQPGSSLDIL